MSHAAVAQKLHALPINPLVSPVTGRRVSIPDAVQNILLFVPFGLLGVAAGGRARAGWRRAIVVTALGALLSFGVETIQLFADDRVTSISDLTANTLGTLFGASAAVWLMPAAQRAAARLVRTRLVDTPAFPTVAVAAVVLCLGAWQPFDVTIDVGFTVAKLRMLRHDIWQFTALSDEGTAFVQYALFGAATTAWLRAVGTRGAAWRAAVIGAIVAAGLEASQLLITSRMPGLADVAVRAAGAAAGVLLERVASHSRARGPWFGLIALAIIAGAAMEVWTPSHDQTTIEAISRAIEQALIYFPLGFCLARLLAPSRRPPLASAGMGLALAAGLDVLRGGLSVGVIASDAVSAALGAGLGGMTGTTGTTGTTGYDGTTGTS